MILPIIKYPEKILKQQGATVPFPLSASNQKLIEDMFDTVRAAKGIGLAAPQVGKSLRIIVVDLSHLGVAAFSLVNPEIVKPSKKETELEEGCLSLPGIYGMVARPYKVHFAGFSPAGERIQAKADGLLAKVIQHEIDHTNGILIIDKITKYTDGK